MTNTLTIEVPVSENGAIASLDALTSACFELLWAVDASWPDRAIIDAFLDALHRTSSTSSPLARNRAFGTHVLQRELILFYGESQDAFAAFVQAAEADADVADFAVIQWDRTGAVIEALELPLASDSLDRYQERVHAAARFLARTGAARGSADAIRALLTLHHVDLITILPQ